MLRLQHVGDRAVLTVLALHLVLEVEILQVEAHLHLLHLLRLIHQGLSS